MRKVVVTGMGILSPTGTGKDEFFANLLNGRSGVQRLRDPFVDKLTTKIAAPTLFQGEHHLSRLKCATLDRTTQLALVAATQAINDAAIDIDGVDRERIGVYWGTGMGSAHTVEDCYAGLFSDAHYRVRPATVVMAMNNAAASQIALDFGLLGPSLTYSSACSSSAVAIGEALRAIRAGIIDRAIVGGADALLTYGTMRAWDALRTLAVEDIDDPGSSCRPFSADRTGFVLGEGAAALVLEEAHSASARAAKIYAELAGYGASTDARHIARPDAQGQARAILAALADAGLAPADLGYINAHGTATQVGDAVETEALKLSLGSYASTIPISSTKALHGHLMGAAGATELVVSLLAMQRGCVPPTAHYRILDPACDLDYVTEGARHGLPLGAVMSNSFAFGGNNAVLVAKDWDG